MYMNKYNERLHKEQNSQRDDSFKALGLYRLAGMMTRMMTKMMDMARTMARILRKRK